jgi:DNA-binding NarL/FixJ family response regulator
MNNPIKVFIADDHTVVLQGLKGLFKEDTNFELCGIENNCEKALEGIKKVSLTFYLLTLVFRMEMVFHYIKVQEWHYRNLKQSASQCTWSRVIL